MRINRRGTGTGRTSRGGRRTDTRRPAMGGRRTDTRRPAMGGRNSTRRQETYLVEFRFHGLAKAIMKDIEHNIRMRFIGSQSHQSQHRMVPHITLAGSLKTRDERRLAREIVAACKKHKIVKFRLDGFDNFDKNVIYVKIHPSPSLISLQKDIATALKDFCEMGEHDFKRTFKFHGTLHMDKHVVMM